MTVPSPFVTLVFAAVALIAAPSVTQAQARFQTKATHDAEGRRVMVANPVRLAPGEMQEAAAVSQLHAMPEIDAKVFSVSGGDPAINGLQTYLGLFAGSAEGWALFPIGDFTDWRVTESAPGLVRIDYRQDVAGPDGDIVGREARVIVEWMPQADGSPPDRVGILHRFD